MKNETRSFYGEVVAKALERVALDLDAAIDLGQLARKAALSPLHFHRIFRGMVGETPLELHRRLRLERAAYTLANDERAVVSVAFEAGYETHESFTRAFREAFAISPTEFRARTREARDGCARPPQYELAARCGVHFDGTKVALKPLSSSGETAMNVDIQEQSEKRVASVSHRGPYNRISEAFARLGEVAGKAGLLTQPGVAMVAIYHDDPESTPAAELRADAGLVVPEGVALPKELNELRIPAGRYAHTTHIGPYTLLGDAWARFMGGWLAESGHRIGNGTAYELYRNTPMDTKPEALKTELFLSIS